MKNTVFRFIIDRIIYYNFHPLWVFWIYGLAPDYWRCEAAQSLKARKTESRIQAYFFSDAVYIHVALFYFIRYESASLSFSVRQKNISWNKKKKKWSNLFINIRVGFNTRSICLMDCRRFEFRIFPSPSLVALLRLDYTVCPIIYQQMRLGEKRWIHDFPMGLLAKWNAARIWTRVNDSIC